MNSYIALNKQVYNFEDFSIVPIRYEDMFKIMIWRNAQIINLRQKIELTIEIQEEYFEKEIKKLFNEKQPSQLLFSFLEKQNCIGYGGLVHISWEDKRAEMSYLVNPVITSNTEAYEKSFSCFIKLIKKVCFEELMFNKLFTETYCNRLKHIKILEKNGFIIEGVLREHIIQNSKFQNSIIHSILETEYNAIKK